MKYLMLLLLSINVSAQDTKKEKQHDGKKTESDQKVDKEFLLFLSEFSDDQDNWVDPEVFNQSTMNNLKSELKETENEDQPNNH